MSGKRYDELSLDSQQLIDAAIYLTEARRIFDGKDERDGREEFIADQPALVTHLRSTYAEDIQSTQPKYFKWHEQGRRIIQWALDIQENYARPHGNPGLEELYDFMGGSELNTLVGLLDNMPYPSHAKGDDLGR